MYIIPDHPLVMVVVVVVVVGAKERFFSFFL